MRGMQLPEVVRIAGESGRHVRDAEAEGVSGPDTRMVARRKKTGADASLFGKKA